MTGESSRLDGLTSWHADWRGLRVAVFGLSVTGFSVADTLAELGAEVLVLAESAHGEEFAIRYGEGRVPEPGFLAEPEALGPSGGPLLEKPGFKRDSSTVRPSPPGPIACLQGEGA